LRIWLLSGWNASGNERLKASGFVLAALGRAACGHALFVGFDVSVQHRHVRAHPEAVSGAVNLEVALSAALVVRDFPAHAFGKDFGAAAR
jgi:hypothetical protein